MRCIIVSIAALVLALSVTGCASSKERQLQRASRTVVDRFAEVDANNNGQLDKAELNAVR